MTDQRIRTGYIKQTPIQMDSQRRIVVGSDTPYVRSEALAELLAWFGLKLPIKRKGR